ncbi:hypothetical protein FHS29_001748 [Saccharothrix tamanrassetensis]|uniref:Uncharacterized protein n=1 Tax=Saccharothrix tamanrassetensis TaxID=1051531 RepID=A0A841CG72_9PSEU|nr:hypothetical protein [Saccharothrix tamanrassetensis]
MRNTVRPVLEGWRRPLRFPLSPPVVLRSRLGRVRRRDVAPPALFVLDTRVRSGASPRCAVGPFVGSGASNLPLEGVTSG